MPRRVPRTPLLHFPFTSASSLMTHPESGMHTGPATYCGIVTSGTMTPMGTQTIERPDVDTEETTDDDAPKFFHYVKKNKIAESAVMGTHVVALCGETFPVTKSPKPGSPVCPKCKKIYEKMKKD